MNVEIQAEAAQFPEKEYIGGIAVAVSDQRPRDEKYTVGRLIHRFCCFS